MKGITGNPALDAYQRFAVKPVQSAREADGPAQAGHRPPSPEAVKVNISTEARAAADSPVNVHKVEGLKAAIADGSFQVDSRLVAQRMLEGLGA
jgi:flagellar biosynthesis anti-sigma factor FlgM